SIVTDLLDTISVNETCKPKQREELKCAFLHSFLPPLWHLDSRLRHTPTSWTISSQPASCDVQSSLTSRQMGHATKTTSRSALTSITAMTWRRRLVWKPSSSIHRTQT